MTAKISHIAPVLTVSDLKAAIDWYERTLGFTPIYVNHEEGDEAGRSWNYALLENGATEIHLCRTVADDATLSSPSNCYVFVSDIEALQKHLSAMDANISDIQEMPWGSLECWLHDPDGTGWSLATGRKLRDEAKAGATDARLTQTTQ